MELGERRSKILAAVVDDYVRTAEPVGSEALVHRYGFGVKPATIRNELAVMSEMGYLRQPHTSAGRVPSDMGYRYYVDELMPHIGLDPRETHQARHSYKRHEGEVEEILQRTCQILSGLTNYTSLATPPQTDTVAIKHISLSAVGEGKILAVMVLNTGHVDHRVLDYQGSLVTADLLAINNVVNVRLRRADLSSFTRSMKEELPSDLRHLNWLYKKVVVLLKQALANATREEVYMGGTAHMLKQPEFSAGYRTAWVLEILERRRELYQILGTALLGRDVTVIIGSENEFEDMQECSFIASSYSAAGKVCGSIGVIGPTRMDYRRAVAAVRFMSSNLSELLTSLGIG